MIGRPVRVLVKRRNGESEGDKGTGESSQRPDDKISGEDSGGRDAIQRSVDYK